MITFTSLGQYGRLGNVLFQFAFLRSVSLRHGYEIVLPEEVNTHLFHGQTCLLNKFKAPYKTLDINEINAATTHRVTEDWTHRHSFVPKLLEHQDNTDFAGYFQNYSYISPIKNEIRSDFLLQDDIEAGARCKINAIKQDNKGYEIVSVHIRRGDMINRDPHYDAMFDVGGTITPQCRYGKYLISSVGRIPGKKLLMIFTGGSRTNEDDDDISWCRENFPNMGLPFIMSPGNSAIEDFSIMSQCDHNILACSSTFGWWASFLNPNTNKIVCCPDVSPTLEPNSRPTPNYYPDDFIKIGI
jgi:hypothetical protein